jgi:hypothetical protein
MMDDFWLAEAKYPQPPARIQRAVDRFDPQGRARAAALFTMNHVTRAAGRRRFGGRPRRWLALEDKTRIETLWRAIGVRHAPSQIVAADLARLESAAARIDRGAGTVWAGDTTGGTHGGAQGTHWVTDVASGRRAARALAKRCRRVRVMPFLPGRPCSVHGLVLPGYTVVSRPVEMITLRPQGEASLRYAGAGTFWDPPDAERRRMRRVTRRVGEALRDRVGFRGPFTLDGVLTNEGFLPTEINARLGGATGSLLSGIPNLPYEWMCLAAIEGLELDWRPRKLERLLLQVADDRRAGRAIAILPARRSATEQHRLAPGAGGLRRARRRDEATSTLVLGPSSAGSYLGWFPDARSIPKGPAFAPRVVEALAWADRVLGTGIGPLEPLPGS